MNRIIEHKKGCQMDERKRQLKRESQNLLTDASQKYFRGKILDKPQKHSLEIIDENEIEITHESKKRKYEQGLLQNGNELTRKKSKSGKFYCSNCENCFKFKYQYSYHYCSPDEPAIEQVLVPGVPDLLEPSEMIYEENDYNLDGYKQTVKSRKYFCAACENFFKYKSQYEKHTCFPINIPESDELLLELKEKSVAFETKDILSGVQEKINEEVTEHSLGKNKLDNTTRTQNNFVKEVPKYKERTRKKIVPHQNKLKHHCTKCEYKFQFKYQLKNHIRDNICDEIGNKMILLDDCSSGTRKTTMKSQEKENSLNKTNDSKTTVPSGENKCEMESEKIETSKETKKQKKILKSVCSICLCQQTFKSSYQLKIHKLTCTRTNNIGGLDGNVPNEITVINKQTKVGKYFCTKCQQTFKLKYEFKKHISTGNCRCTDGTEQHSKNEPKKTTVQTNNHIEQTKIGKHFCCKCQQSFKLKYEFKKHLYNCKATYDAEQHNDINESKETSVLTTEQMKIGKHFCSKCQQSFKFKYEFKNHRNCKTTDGNEQHNTNEPKETSGLINEQTKIRKHFCSKCQQSFKFKYEFKNHQLNCKTTDGREQHNINEPKETSVLTNEQTKIGKHFCSKCQQSFKFKYEFKNHQCTCKTTEGSEQHINEPKETSVLTNEKTKFGKHFCSKCQQSFKFKYEFKNHQRNCKTADGSEQHNINEPKETSVLINEQTKIGKHFCSKCQQSFKFKYEYKNHQHNCKTTDGSEQHNIIEPKETILTNEQLNIGKYFCSKCQQSFKFKYEFKNHQVNCKNTDDEPNMIEPKEITVVRNEQTKTKKNFCSKCQQGFKFKYEIKNHQHNCNTTDDGEQHNMKYEQGLLSNGNELTRKKSKSGKYYCSNCENCFKFKYQYNYHYCYPDESAIEQVLVPGVPGILEPSEIRIEPKETTVLTNEQTKTRNNFCSECQQSFKFRYEFKKHQSNCKTSDGTEQLNIGNEPNEITVVTNEQTITGKHLCPKCHHIFKFKYEFKKHQKNCKTNDENNMNEPKDASLLPAANKQTKIGKHFCPKCQQSFKFKYEYKEHQNNCKIADDTEQLNMNTDRLKIKQYKKKGRSKKLCCLACNKSFTFCYQYKQHIYMFHSGEMEKIIKSYLWNDENAGNEIQMVEDNNSVCVNHKVSDTLHKEYQICIRCSKIFKKGKLYEYHRCIPVYFTDEDIKNIKNKENVLRKGAVTKVRNFFCKDCHEYFQYWYQFKTHSCEIVVIKEGEEEEEEEVKEVEVTEMEIKATKNKRCKYKRWKPNILEIYDHSSDTMITVYHCKICDLFFEAYKNFDFHNDFHFMC